MRTSLQTLGLSIFVVVALIVIGIGLLPGMNPWISVVMATVLLALPLPFIARALLPEANQLQEAGLRVPSFAGFDVLADRYR